MQKALNCDDHPTTKVPPLVVDRPEAAAALRISIRKLDYLIERGEIVPARVDGRVLIAWTELERFVNTKTWPVGAGRRLREVVQRRRRA